MSCVGISFVFSVTVVTSCCKTVETRNYLTLTYQATALNQITVGFEISSPTSCSTSETIVVYPTPIRLEASEEIQTISIPLRNGLLDIGSPQYITRIKSVYITNFYINPATGGTYTFSSISLDSCAYKAATSRPLVNLEPATQGLIFGVHMVRSDYKSYRLFGEKY